MLSEYIDHYVVNFTLSVLELHPFVKMLTSTPSKVQRAD